MAMHSNRGELRESLAESAPFSMLTREVVDELFECMQLQEFPEEALVIEQGQPADGLMVLLSGSVEVRVRDHEGVPSVIAELGPGDVMGETALLTREPRSADVVATSGVRVLSLSAADFESLASRHPEVTVVLTEILADRLGGQKLDMLGGKSFEGYRILRCVGRGGMAVVYEALDEARGGERVALKMMNHRLLYRVGALARFQREADLLMRLEHDNITRVSRCFSAFRTSFLAMEFCDGQVLSEYIEGRGPLPEAEVRGFLGQLASALTYLHAEEVIHRDLKPSNVLMTRKGQIKLTDFGLARPWSPIVTSSSLTTEGTIIGTPLYMAPEQILGQKVGPEADLYAFGCIGLELLLGRLPFEAQDLASLIDEKRGFELPAPGELGRGVGRELHDLLAACMRRAPEERTPDLAAVTRWAAPFGLA